MPFKTTLKKNVPCVCMYLAYLPMAHILIVPFIITLLTCSLLCFVPIPAYLHTTLDTF